MALTIKDIKLIGDMIEQRIDANFKQRTQIDAETHRLDHEFTQRQRHRYERFRANRQMIVNKTIVAIGVALVLGILYNAPTIVRALMGP